MSKRNQTGLRGCVLGLALLGMIGGYAVSPVQGAEPEFYRGINLNGPAVRIEGHSWESEQEAKNLRISGKVFENQSVLLKPLTDRSRSQMIRSSRWGSRVEVVLTDVPPGLYQVFFYVWEDNHDEQFDLLVNDQVVEKDFHSGQAGMWRRMGPWLAAPMEGEIKIASRGPGHGAANFSGIEIWRGEGDLPEVQKAEFALNPSPEQVEYFERFVRPVLVENCYECHSSQAEHLKGGLLLDSRAGIMKGGDIGGLITPGDPETSLLIQAVRHADPNLAMPPKKDRLSEEVIAHLETWIKMGAPDPRTENTVASLKARSAIDWDKAREWWSFRPLSQPQVPSVRQSDWPRTEVDYFILRGLEQAGIKPAPDAQKRVLLRRVTYDLTGLPPTPEAIRNFLSDQSAEAFDRVVDRLLDSPQYGERWGRHWLDVVRYADTAGDNSDYPIPQMYRYRNWVINAFNRDLPYDQMVLEQLAGDLLPSEDLDIYADRLVATGYIANSRRFGSRVEDYPMHLTIEDTLANLGRTFLGMSLNCARCHDHKFDPITAEDYYSLYGFFHNTRYPWPGIELDKRQRRLVPLVSSEHRIEAEQALQEFERKGNNLEKEVQSLKKKLKDLSEPSSSEKTDLEKSLAEAEKALKDHLESSKPYEVVYAVAEQEQFEEVELQRKGDPSKPGDKVPRRFLTVLGGNHLEEGQHTSGRLALARWIVSEDNSLAPRVMANRIWQYHFGRGIVPTSNDFGKQGKPPTHPELLDWLAFTFRESGWSIKNLHRLILRSRVYQMSSHRSAEEIEVDPGNEKLGAFSARRLDAEAIRDTLKFLGGSLDLAPGGEHPFPPESTWGFTQHNPFKAVYETDKRSVYLMTQRIQRHPFLATFDGADPATSTEVRLTSTTPIQALLLLNDASVHREAAGFAARLMMSESTEESRLHLLYEMALGRLPSEEEVGLAIAFLTRFKSAGLEEHEAWTSMARAVFRLNEFLYID